jgi:hypothetical protein
MPSGDAVKHILLVKMFFGITNVAESLVGDATVPEFMHSSHIDSRGLGEGCFSRFLYMCQSILVLFGEEMVCDAGCKARQGVRTICGPGSHSAIQTPAS